MRFAPWRLPILVGLLAGTTSAATADQTEPPYGIDHRVPWTNSHVVGSPNPPPPYRVRRAFPKLTFNQPLYVVTEPGTDDMLVISHDGGYEGPGHVVRLEEPARRRQDGAVSGHKPDRLWSCLPSRLREERLHLRRQQRPRRRQGQAGPRVAVHRGPQAAIPLRPEVGSCDPRMGVERPQRRRPRLRPRRLSLRHIRRRHQRLRRRPPRPGPDAPDGQGAAHRRGPSRRRQALFRAEGQPLRGPQRGVSGDVGLRHAQPVADDLRPQDRPALGRPERPGSLGAGLRHPQGRQLRLERQRGQPPLPAGTRARPRPDRHAGRRAPPFRVPFADRRRGLLRGEVPRPGRRLHLRRLLHRRRSGRRATTGRRRFRTRRWRTRGCKSSASASTRTANC